MQIERIRELIGYLVSMAAEQNEKEARMFADELEVLLSEPSKDVQLYLGNYGFPLAEYPHCEPPTLPKWAWDFVDRELKKNISRMNQISWIQDRLKILGDMLEDREQKYFADEICKLIIKIG